MSLSYLYKQDMVERVMQSKFETKYFEEHLFFLSQEKKTILH